MVGRSASRLTKTTISPRLGDLHAYVQRFTTTISPSCKLGDMDMLPMLYVCTGEMYAWTASIVQPLVTKAMSTKRNLISNSLLITLPNQAQKHRPMTVLPIHNIGLPVVGNKLVVMATSMKSAV